MKTVKMLLLVFLLSSCAHKNTKEETNKYSDLLKNDLFTYTGDYVWAFNLMGTEQVSTHTFYPDSISYTMKGKIHTTAYTIKKLSYEKAKNKWIGEDKDGIVYVLFFKEKTAQNITIYKHKCKTNGLDEALKFKVPAPNATDDHGWNVYTINKDLTKDLLPISGNFIHDNGSIFISDSVFKIDKRNITKMSFHVGERRWVGQLNNQYLQVFFKNLNTKDSVQLSLNWSKDLKALYNTKYNTITHWETYAKH